MSQQRIMKLATRGKRFVAGLIDTVPFWIAGIGITSWFLTTVVTLIQNTFNSYSNYDSYYNSEPYVYQQGISGSSIFFVLIVVYLAVQIYFYTRSQSIGKAILGLRVVDSKTGRPIGFAKMLLREIIVKKASSAILWLGYFWILFDKYNRSWHDKILDTYVIDERPTKAPQPYAAGNPYNNPYGSPSNGGSNASDFKAAQDTMNSANMQGANWNPRQEIYQNMTQQNTMNSNTMASNAMPQSPSVNSSVSADMGYNNPSDVLTTPAPLRSEDTEGFQVVNPEVYSDEIKASEEPVSYVAVEPTSSMVETEPTLSMAETESTSSMVEPEPTLSITEPEPTASIDAAIDALDEAIQAANTDAAGQPEEPSVTTPAFTEPETEKIQED